MEEFILCGCKAAQNAAILKVDTDLRMFLKVKKYYLCRILNSW